MQPEEPLPALRPMLLVDIIGMIPDSDLLGQYLVYEKKNLRTKQSAADPLSRISQAT